MRCLVTGGAGFIGSTLTDRLITDGHEVCVVDDLSGGRREQVNDAVAEFAEIDINADVEGVMHRFRPETVFHQAAQIDVRRSVNEPQFDTQVNVLGTVNLLSAAVRSGARRFIFASSGGALYGDTDDMPTPESHEASPMSQYGAAKLCGEIYGRVFARLSDLEFVALRYSNVYGPRQDPHGEAGVIAIFTERLLRGEPTRVFGQGTQTRDYVYVDDVVAANCAALTGPPGAYNVATSRECDVNELHRRLAEACGSASMPERAPARPGEQSRSCLDISLARERLGWSPQVSLDAGIPKTVAFFREHLGTAPR